MLWNQFWGYCLWRLLCLFIGHWYTIYFELHLLQLFQVLWVTLAKPHCHFFCVRISHVIVAILAVYFYFLFLRNEWLWNIVHNITHSNFGVAVMTHSNSFFLVNHLLKHSLVVSLWLVHQIKSSFCWWVIWSLLLICETHLFSLHLALAFFVLVQWSKFKLWLHVVWRLNVFFLDWWFVFFIHFNFLDWKRLLEATISEWIFAHL